MEPGLAGWCYISLCEFHLYIYTHKVTSLLLLYIREQRLLKITSPEQIRNFRTLESGDAPPAPLKKSHGFLQNILHRPLDGHFCLLLLLQHTKETTFFSLIDKKFVCIMFSPCSSVVLGGDEMIFC